MLVQQRAQQEGELRQQEQRQLVLSFFCAVFGAAAALCYGQLKRLLNPPQAAFSASLTELQEDIRRLKKAASHAGAPD